MLSAQYDKTKTNESILCLFATDGISISAYHFGGLLANKTKK